MKFLGYKGILVMASLFIFFGVSLGQVQTPGMDTLGDGAGGGSVNPYNINTGSGISAPTGTPTPSQNSPEYNPPSSPQAQDNEGGTGWIQCSGTNCDLNSFMATVTNVMNNIYILSFSVATLLFIYAGFLLMSSGDDVSKRARAKGIFKNVIIGFIIMFLSYFFIWTLLKSLGVEADFLFFLTG